MTGGSEPDAVHGQRIAQSASAEDSERDITTALIAEFTERAGALGVVVEWLEESETAARTIDRVMAEVGAGRVLIAAELAEAAPDLVQAIERAGRSWALPGEPAQVRDEQLGASLALAAVAETGSVLLAEEGLPDRAIGMLVGVHVIVCRTETIVPSLDEAAPILRELASRPGGAYATLVTGPSRTADIERVLTVGVQGPGRVIVLFVDGLR